MSSVAALALGCVALPEPVAPSDPEAPSVLEACLVPSKRAPEPVVGRAPLPGAGRPAVRPVPLDLEALPRAVPDVATPERSSASPTFADDAPLGPDGGAVPSPLLLLARSEAAPSPSPVHVGAPGRCPLVHPIDAVRATLVTGGAGAATLVLAHGRVATPGCTFTERARRRVAAVPAGDSGAFAFRGCGRACGEPETLGLVFPVARRLVGDRGATATAPPAGFSLALVPLDGASTLLAELEHVAVLELAHLVADRDAAWRPELVDRFVAPRVLALEVVGDASLQSPPEATLFFGER